MGPTHRLAIDLGTCHTVAVVRRGDEAPRALLFDGSPVMASGIYADETGKLSVGRDAERLSQLAPERFEPYPKRSVDEGAVLLGQVEVTVVEMLASLLRRAAEESLQAGVNPVGSTVLTCPADWGGQRRGVLLEAARAANLGPVVLVDEPIAAATYCLRVLGQQVAPLQSLAVFDFGGGTLDVSVVRREFDGLRVLGVGGLDDLGGVDIDAALVGHLGQLINLRHPEIWQRVSSPDSTAAHRDRRALWTEVRAAKEMLSRASSAPIHVPGTEEALHLTREELERVAGPLIDRAVDETRRVLERAGVDVRQLAGIFLVGGSSRIPLVASRLHARFGVAPVVPEQPELPVAYGGMLAVATPPQQQFDAPPMPRPRPVSGSPVSPGQSPGFQRPANYPVSAGFPVSSAPTSPGGYGSPAGTTSQAFAAAPAPTSAPPGSTPPAGLRPQAPTGFAGPGQAMPGQGVPGQGMPGQRPPMPPSFGAPPGGQGPYGAPPGSQGPYGPAPLIVRPRRRTGPWIALVIVLALIGSCVWGGNKLFGWMGDQFQSVKDNLPGSTATDDNGNLKDANVEGLQAGSPITLTTGGSLDAVAGGGSVYTAAVTSGATDVTAYSTTGGQKWNVKLQMEPKEVALTLVGNLLLIDGADDTKRGDGGGDTRSVIDVGTGTEKWTKPYDDRHDLVYLGTDTVTEVGGFRKVAVERVNLLTGEVRWSHPGDPNGTYINGNRGVKPSIRWPGAGSADVLLVPTYTLSFSGRTPYQESLGADAGVVVQLQSETKASTIDLATGKVKATGTIARDRSADSWLVYNDLALFKPDADNAIVAYKLSDMTKAWEYKATAGTTVDDLRPCGEKLVCVKGEQSGSKNVLVAIDTTSGAAKWTRTALADKKDTKSTRTSEANWYVLGGKLVGGTGVFTTVEQAAVIDPSNGNDQLMLGKGLAQQSIYAGAGNNVAIMSYSGSAWRLSIVNVGDGKIVGGADVSADLLQDVSLSNDTAVVLDKDKGLVYRYTIPGPK